MKSIDLFAGGGGASCGIELAGKKVVCAVEKDERLANVYNINFPRTEMLIEDIRNIPNDYFANSDHIHLSPPCQEYSKPNGDRNSAEALLSLEALRFIECTTPSVVTLENVLGYAKSSVWQMARGKLLYLGYSINEKCLNFYDYGLPQSRQRFIAIASRNGGVKFPDPIPQEERIGWLEALLPYKSRWVEGELAPYQIQGLSGIDVKSQNLWIPRAGSHKNKNGILLGVRSATDPAPTIKLAGNCSRHSYFANFTYQGKVYRITPFLASILQGFPPSYKLPSVAYLAQKIVGNAFPPSVAKKVFEVLG